VADIDAILRRNAAAGLDLSERELWSLIEASPMAILVTQRDGSVAYSNPSAHAMIGLTREQYDRHNIAHSYVDPAQRDRLYELMARDGRAHNFELQLKHSNGSVIWVMLSATPFDTPGGRVVFVWATEVTARKRTEAALRASEARLNAILESSPVGIAVVSAEGGLLFCNARFRELRAIDARAIDRYNARDFFVDPAHYERIVEQVYRDGAAPETAVATIGADGTRRRELTSARRFPFEGHDAHIVWVYDITPRQRLEDALARERAELVEKTGLLETLLESLDQGAILFDAEGRVGAYNHQVCALLGMPPALLDGATGRMIRDYLAARGDFGPEQQAMPAFLREENYAKQQPWLDAPMTFERRRANGTMIEVRSNPMPGRRGWAQTYTDVTARHQAAEQIRIARDRAERALSDLRAAQDSLVQSEKLASLGALVAGIAQEIRAPVEAARSAAGRLRDRTTAMAELMAHGGARRSDAERFAVETSAAAVELVADITRAAELVQSFKQVAVDRTSGGRRVFRLRRFIEEVALSLEPRLKPAGHAIVVECPDDLELNSYPGALSQVLTNLALNSLIHGFDADRAGTIRITAARTASDADDDVVLSFDDDGKGIPEEHHGRVFEPFFTTRRGTGAPGLGLGVVRDIVTATLKGRIAMTSRPGAGTRFEIRFPRSVPDPRPPGGDAAARS